MKLPLIVATLVLLLNSAAVADTPGGASTPAAPRDVWSRALQSTANSSEFVPGRTVMTMEFLDRRGEVEETLKVLVITREENGELVSETTELERPGGIIGRIMSGETPAPDGMTSASQSDEPDGGAAEEDGDEDGPALTDPFHPSVQDSVRLGAAAGTELVEGERSTRFPIAWSSPDGTRYEGSVWLNDETGGPVQLDVVGESWNDAVRSFTIAVGYGATGDTYLPVWSTSEIEFRFALVIKVRVRVLVEFAEYFRPAAGS